jgi:hypothetical protein
MENTSNLVYRIELMEKLVEEQRNALQISNDLIELKNRMILLLEDEIKMHKKNNLLISIMLIALAILFIILFSLTCIL